jgi:hypothetical protein
VPEPSGIFDERFLTVLQGLVSMHHTLYPNIPPRDIFFESLVEVAFDRVQKPWAPISATVRSFSGHDLLVDDKKMSIKTETGAGTKESLVNITKLCTTEKEPWDAATLVPRVMAHLSRYDVILMLRAIWREGYIHYQLLELPIADLRLIGTAQFGTVGRRQGRRSLGADIKINNEVILHAHFDASDGKCQISKLPVSRCVNLAEWDQRLPAQAHSQLADLRNTSQ